MKRKIFTFLCIASSLFWSKSSFAQCDGGSVSDINGDTITYTCPGDGNADVVTFSNMGGTATYAYVVTDANNVIVGLPGGNSNDFEGAGVGVCRVWGVSYTGNVTATVGDTVGVIAFSDTCFDWSSNYLEINRGTLDGGTVADGNGSTIAYTCPSDGRPDVVNFTMTGSALNYAYVITDTNDIILGLPGGTMHDFEGAGTGTCRVWGVSYAGTVTATMGDTVGVTAFSNSCFDWSSNFIEIVRDMSEGGSVADDNGLTTVYTCPGDGNPDIINFTNTSTSNANYAYVITDANNVVAGTPPGNMANLEGAGVGVCRVWGVSYTGVSSYSVGDTVGVTPYSDNCFEWSTNFITVVRDTADGGTVADSNGDTLVNVIVGDGNADNVTFTNTSVSSSNYAYVITDTNDVVLGTPGSSHDFEGADEGICRVWGVSFSGTTTYAAGDTVGVTPYSDGCFQWSSNFIEIDRDSSTVGVDDNINDNNRVKIFPNPTNGVLNIVTATFNSVHSLSIIDIHGRLVNEVIADNDGVQTIDLSEVKNGVYFVKVSGNEVNAILRVVKN